MTPVFDPRAARKALASIPVLAAHETLDPPQLNRVYVPERHAKALHLDASVVVGMRGAGKSWWTAVLASDEHRRFVADQIQGSALGGVVARVGFGLDDTQAEFPNPETLASLVETGIDASAVWLAVVLRHALRAVDRPVPFESSDWRGAVGWVIAHRNEANDLLTACDNELVSRNRVLLVLFDAFDRLANDWGMVRSLTTGALQLTLRLRSRRSIRAKLFIRPDLEEDDAVWRFADSSKLRHSKVLLEWSSSDLYSLVLMHLGNTPEFGQELRDETRSRFGVDWDERDNVYLPPFAISRSAKHQRQLIELLADDTMGGGSRRGFTYTWVPLHLADAKGRVSPRSYLLAFKSAAEDAAERYDGHALALHHRAIQQGVVKASEVRVAEITEDYPWVRPLLEAARGTVVPIETAELSRQWTPDCLGRMKDAVGSKLPPRRFTNDPFRSGSADALIDDLVELAVLYRTRDGRLNMPDIFRVGVGIRRKGGVKPLR
ncbi:MAG: hypothetical protein AAB426_06005 [Myxococcota bacterium]